MSLAWESRNATESGFTYAIITASEDSSTLTPAIASNLLQNANSYNGSVMTIKDFIEGEQVDNIQFGLKIVGFTEIEGGAFGFDDSYAVSNMGKIKLDAASEPTLTTIGSHILTAVPVTTIEIPSSVTSINPLAFSGSSIDNIIVDSDNTTYSTWGVIAHFGLVSGVLYNKAETELLIYPPNKGIGSITIPEGVTTIGEKAFHNNTTIASVTLASTITNIKLRAFKGTTSLVNLLPNLKSTMTIGDYAFEESAIVEIVAVALTIVDRSQTTTNETTITYNPISPADPTTETKSYDITSTVEKDEKTVTYIWSETIQAVGNRDPTGSVTISGTPTQGETLTAVTSTITDVDGLGDFSYQWKRGEDVISGATSSTYTLVQADVGKTISVTVSYTDQRGFAESVTSSSTTTVANVNDSPTGSVTITGTTTEGKMLTAVTSSMADADGLGSFSYQWKRGGVNITGATSSTYTLVQADVGKKIKVTVTYTDQGGTTESVTSAETTNITNTNNSPTGSVTITGTTTEGSILEVDTNGISDSDGLTGVSFSYQWKRGGVNITGATSSTYTLVQGDVGKKIKVTVTYEDQGGTTENVTSAETSAVANVNDLPTGTVTITGTVTQGEVLTANTTSIADADGLGTFSYKWNRGEDVISGATSSTYTLVQGDVGKTITVTVSYTDDEGTYESVTSAATDPVTNVNDSPSGTVTISGTTTQGEVLTASNDIADEDGLGYFTYQWKRAGSDISEATNSTYTLVQSDVGNKITVTVSYTDSQGTNESVTSAETSSVANVNDSPTEKPQIVGTTSKGSVLTADTDAITDADGLIGVTFTYQWNRGVNTISGATSKIYTLVQADVGETISVTVTYEDGGGVEETLTSDPTSTIENVNRSPSGKPTLTGLTPGLRAKEGDVIGVDTSTITDADGLGNFSYQWNRDGATISGAIDTTYTLVQADVGTKVSVTLTYTDGGGVEETLTSDDTDTVDNVNDNPVGKPIITGVPKEDKTLTVDMSKITDADGIPDDVTFTYLWSNGKTGDSITLEQADVGKKISVTVSYTDSQGVNEEVTSGETEEVTNENDDPVYSFTFTMDGPTYPDGIELKFDVTDPAPRGPYTSDEGVTVTGDRLAYTFEVSDEDDFTKGDVYKYTWYNDDGIIENATDTAYTVTESDTGQQIYAVISYIDGQGTTETLPSKKTKAVISGENNLVQGKPGISGEPKQNEKLTATIDKITDEDEINMETVSYIWFRDGDKIGGQEESTYTTTQQDVEKKITVKVTYRDARGVLETSESSDEIGPIENVNDPLEGKLPITGVVKENETLTINERDLIDIDGLPAASDRTRKWYRDGVEITGDPNVWTNRRKYVLTQEDVGKVITASVSYKQNEIEHSITSAEYGPVENVNDPPTGEVTIEGIFKEGQTLTTNTSALDDKDGFGTFSYTWERAGNPIIGATSTTYTLTRDDVNKEIKVQVKYTDGYGTEEIVDSSNSVTPTLVFQNRTEMDDIYNKWYEESTKTTTKYGPENTWGTEKIQDFSCVFNGRIADKHPDISLWDTTNATKMDGLFSFSNINRPIETHIENENIYWDMSNVQSTIGMFYGNLEFNQRISNWYVPSLRNAQYMFSACRFNKSIKTNSDDITVKTYYDGKDKIYMAWNMERVEDMRYMFANNLLFNQPISNWSTYQAKLEGMFYNAMVFNQLIGEKYQFPNGKPDINALSNKRDEIISLMKQIHVTLVDLITDLSSVKSNFKSFIYTQIPSKLTDLQTWTIEGDLDSTQIIDLCANCCTIAHNIVRTCNAIMNDDNKETFTPYYNQLLDYCYGKDGFKGKLSFYVAWYTGSVENMNHFLHNARLYNRGIKHENDEKETIITEFANDEYYKSDLTTHFTKNSKACTEDNFSTLTTDIAENILNKNETLSKQTERSKKDEDLTNQDFSNKELTRTNYTGADLQGTDFSNSNLIRANFATTKMNSETNLTGATLNEVKSGGITMYDNDKQPKLPDGYNLIDGYIMGPYVDVSITNGLEYSNLTNMNLRGVNLEETNLNNATLIGVKSRLIKSNVKTKLPENYVIKDGFLLGPKVNLVAENFSGLNLTGINLTEANSEGANFSNTKLNYVKLTKTNLKQANLRGAELKNAEMDYTNIENADLRDVIFTNTRGTNIKSNDYTTLPVNYVILNEFLLGPGVSLQDITLNASMDLSNLQLTRVNFESAKLSKANLTNTNFKAATLEGADLTKCLMKETNLTGANLTGATLKNITSENIVFDDKTQLPTNYKIIKKHLVGPYAQLDNIDFEKADFRGTSLEYASLKGANLKGADLEDVSLKYASLKGANLKGANLKGARLENAVLEDVTSGNIIISNETTVSSRYQLVNGYIVGKDVNIEDEDLGKGILESIDLTGVKMSGANLSGLTFIDVKTRSIGTYDNLQLSEDYKIFGDSIIGPGVDITDEKEDFKNADLTNMKLINAKFNEVDFSEATLTGLQTSGSDNVSDIKLPDGYDVKYQSENRKTYIIGPDVDLTNMDLTNMDLTEFDFDGITSGGKIVFNNKTQLPDEYSIVQNTADDTFLFGPKVRLINKLLTTANDVLNNAILYNSDFSLSTFGGNDNTINKAILSDVKFTNGKIVGTINDSQLTGADLSGTDASEAKFIEIISGGVTTNQNTILPEETSVVNGYIIAEKSVLPGANLADADLSGAFLEGANLTNANLVNANLSGANLVKADLDQADMTNINLEGADLTDASLFEVTSSNVRVNAKTKLPDGYRIVDRRIIKSVINET
jgi:uncharacterized protein YjbI with pentapeptide repeats